METLDPQDILTLPGLADCLREVANYVGDYAVLTEPEQRILALYVFHTHMFRFVDRTPYLHVSSPTKRCGKSTLLDALDLLVCNSARTSNITSAALAWKVDCEHPTLLIDEADRFVNGRGERAEALRGILNAGFARGGIYTRCVGGHAQDFEVFCPKVIVGLGELPDTITDRSIPIRMKRAKPGEMKRRFDRREVVPRAAVLKAEVECLAAAAPPLLKAARPERMVELNDRQNDITEPLLVIADLAGGNWPMQLREDLRELLLAQGEDQSPGIRLLADIREIFRERSDPKRLRNAVLAQALAERQDSPWPDLPGKGLTTYKLAMLLRKFDIHPALVRDGAEGVMRCYEASAFQDAWARYLPNEREQ